MVHLQPVPYVIPLILAAIVSTALALYVWRRRPAPGATLVAVLLLIVSEWLLTYAWELGSVDLPAKIFWAQTEYLAIASIPVAWVIFAIQYTGRDKWLTRRNLLLLTLIPALTLLLAWTNALHGLIWSATRLDTGGSFSMLDLDHGTWFWVHLAYSYLLLALGTVWLIQGLVRAARSHLYRGQVIIALLGALAPWVGNFLYVSNLSPFPHLDLTPFAFAVTGLAVVWGLFRYRLLDIVPVAREAVIESMGDSVIVLDAQGRIVDLNPAAQRITGQSASQLIGQPAEQVFSAWPDLVERYRGVVETQAEIAIGEGAARRHYDLRFSPLFDWPGRANGQLIVVRDTTERQQVEEELRRAKDAAEAASRAKSTFLANMSHELRTPLSAIIGYSELLEEEAQDRGHIDLIPDLRKIHAAGSHLLTLISEILDLSKIEAGRMAIHLETFDLAAVVADVVTTSQLLTTKNGNVLQVDCPADLGVMHADLTKVRQILLNLLNNAAKFTHQGTISLSVARETVDGTAWICFRVADTGIGIAPEQVQSLFQPFTQADASIAHQYGGTGLGLAISQRFCQMMGGEISVESAPGQGSTFIVHLPAEVSGAHELPINRVIEEMAN